MTNTNDNSTMPDLSDDRAPAGLAARSIMLCAALSLMACAPDSAADGSRTAPRFDAIGVEETVRLTGTEPFWGGEVTGERLTYTTPENMDGAMIDVSRFEGLNGISWSGELEGAPFDLSVTEGGCSDGMSDRRYPFTATLSVRGETRRGCAWTEARSYEGPANP